MPLISEANIGNNSYSCYWTKAKQKIIYGLILQYQKNKLRSQIILSSDPLKGWVLNVDACWKLPSASSHTNFSNERFNPLMPGGNKKVAHT